MRHADRQRQGVHLPDHGDRFQERVLRLRSQYTAGCSDEITPADIAPEIKAELNRLTALAYKACRCRGVVRVDFIVTPEGKPYLIEINSIPGMSGGSIVPKQVREAGMTPGNCTT